MKNRIQGPYQFFPFLFLIALAACNDRNQTPSDNAIKAINLKRGEVVLCGPPDKQFGTVEFTTFCPAEIRKDFNLGIALLHSFEYDEAEKVFAKIIGEEPGCAMAYWGVAMSNFHPLWSPPNQAELEKGAKAIEIAQALPQKSKIETAYIDAIALFYKDFNKIDHITRCIRLEKAMEKMHTDYPGDKEVGIFYALALDGAADPTDKTLFKQRKAGAILSALYPAEPDHPGIIHYIIHSYDYPELAALALPAARKYASIAPSSAHAQHMPSHIFTRLGLWDESIHSNLVSVASAQCYAKNTGIKGHWDEELHGMDYLVYAYLQKGENQLAKQQYDYLTTMHAVYPVNFKVAYSFAAIPARYFLENKMWKEAATLKMPSVNFSWQNFPWQNAIVHFARALGSAHMGHIDSAEAELKNLTILYDTLIKQKDAYKANQVQIEMKISEAWILFKKRKNTEALTLMESAVGMEDNTQKHPVTPGEVLPARELLGDMLMQMNQPGKALNAYAEDLKRHPNRFNGLYGAGLACETSNKTKEANDYYRQLINISDSINSKRPELAAAKLFLQKRK
ncbi:MAG: hypothetical protein ABJB86_00590 [Bacteroidota bacterium]